MPGSSQKVDAELVAASPRVYAVGVTADAQTVVDVRVVGGVVRGCRGCRHRLTCANPVFWDELQLEKWTDALGGAKSYSFRVVEPFNSRPWWSLCYQYLLPLFSSLALVEL